MGNDGKLRLEPAVKSPEIHRMTPYEFALTAEPGQHTITCVRPLQVESSTLSTTVSSRIQSLPASFLNESGPRIA